MARPKKRKITVTGIPRAPAPAPITEYYSAHKLSGYPGTTLVVRSVSAPDPEVFEHLPLLQLIEFLRTHGWLTQARYFGPERET
jgi:hypothetical protein